MQAVAAGNRFYVTAYQEGTIRLSDDITLVVHTPGIYMLSLENGRLRIEASDPTHTQSSLSLTINDYDLKIMVPANQAPGQSVSVTPVISAPLVKSISVDGKKDDWQQIPVSVSGLTAPWNGAAKDRTRVLCLPRQEELIFPV